MRYAAGMGAIAGMRTMAAPALLSEYLNSESARGLKNSKLSFVRNTMTSRVFEFLAAGEMAADKSDNAPARIEPMGLMGRILSGAFVGSVIYVYGKKSFLEGAIVGGVSAAASTFISYYSRKALDENTSISDKAIGAVEDAAVIGGSVALKASQEK